MVNYLEWLAIGFLTAVAILFFVFLTVSAAQAIIENTKDKD